MEQQKPHQKVKHLRIALVHDFLLTPGGAEKVLEALAELFPQAPIYTLLYDEKGMRGQFATKVIFPSRLQRFPQFFRSHPRWLLPFFPSAVEAFDLREYDLILSSSGAWSKGIVTRLRTKHISYLHSPMRFVWDYANRYWKDLHKKPGVFRRLFLSYLRVWDAMAADRPDVLLVNSRYTQERVAKFYRRESHLLYPPVDFIGGEVPQKQREEYFLVVSRLTPSKRLDVALEVCNKLRLPLRIVGQGRDLRRLRRKAGSTVSFLGWQPPEKLAHLYRHARALLLPSEEDFGIVAVEALSCGTPVIAYGRGGVREIFGPEGEGRVGEYALSQTPEVFADALRRFFLHEFSYDQEFMRKRARLFTKERFQENLLHYLQEFL